MSKKVIDDNLPSHRHLCSPKLVESKNLPLQDLDEVLTLYAHYFLASALMLKNYKKLAAKWDQRGRLSQNERVQFSIYFCTWLGFLAVTAEGFKKLTIRKLIQDARPPDFHELIPQADALGKLLKKHDDSLRKFRNNVFHLRASVDELVQFFNDGPTRLVWAEELQAAFDDFFSSYRVFCQVQYVIEGRKSELFK